ncbi:AMP-binding protein [Saccharothrix syringae]|uniref:Carrier domain-containing protein n=1 Tax=Saccharothrix syringae TaxID=103733 RepID=A0A5Q0GY47_SACSY|nr:AMP-binding protein [Saccharothrix syringae]QFZ18901.1 hypothetical protein EKG83_16875 [Saccharothrix syringae]
MALVVFDCFDTIVVPTPNAPRLEQWADLFAAHLRIPQARARRAVYPMITSCLGDGPMNLATEDVLRRTLCRGPGAPPLADALDALWVAAGNADGRYAAAPGVHALLARLRAEGHTLRLLSNCVLTRDHMTRLLRDLDLLAPFDELHLSSEGVGKKPGRAFFQRAAHGSWDRVVMVGDSPEVDLATAADLGWATVDVLAEPDPWAAVLARAGGAPADPEPLRGGQAHLTDALRWRAREQPSRVAHRVVGGDALTFGEWRRRAEALAARISASCAPGSRVGLAFARTEAAEAAVALLAAWLVEAVPVLLPADRAVRSAVTDGLGLVGVLDGSGWAWRRPVDDVPDPYTGPEERRDAAVVLTSGTEGMPKAVAVPRCDLVRDVPEPWSPEVMVNLSPLSTVDALGNLTAPLLDGRLVVTLNGVTGEGFRQAVEEHRPTYLKLVPSMIRLLAASGTPPTTSVTRIALGSAAIGVPDVAALRALFPRARIEADYSSTESGRASLVCRVDDYETTGWAGELGAPRFGGGVRLVDEDGAVIGAPGVPGEIQLRPPDGVPRRVITLPGQAPRRAADGWVPMGDVGEYDDRGRLWFRCRTSEVVNVGGEKVSLPDVEAALLLVPGIAEVATAAVAHPVLGSAVAALVVPADGADTALVRGAVARRFRGADRPGRIGFVDRIPLNDNGKVSRAEVARLVAEAPQQVAPVTEDAFMAVVRAALGDGLSVTDSVVDSGASSLGLVLLCVDLEWSFGVLLDVFDVLSAPSFADLIAVTRERQHDAFARP